MNPKELRGLMEAYTEVYAPQKEIDEAVKGESSERRRDLADERRSGHRPKSAKEGERYASHKLSQMAYAKRKRMGEEVEEVGEEMKPLPKEKMERQAQRAYGKEVRAAAAGDEKETNRQMQRRIAIQMPSSRRNVLQNKKMSEELDIFDIVLEFLQSEGYAETLEEAEWIMANVIDEEAIEMIAELTGGKGHPGYRAGSRDLGPMQSGHPADTFKRTMKGGTMSQRHGDHLGDLDDKDDDEDDLEAGLKDTARKKRENVRKPLRDKVRAARKVLSKEAFVDEAQSARENPEKYEREQSKKYAPVRGERTPMPPRGNKKREDFEKWYAANVR